MHPEGAESAAGGIIRGSGDFPEQIDALAITGNTAMLYLLTETDPDCLSHAPFEASRLFGELWRGVDLELPLSHS